MGNDIIIEDKNHHKVTILLIDDDTLDIKMARRSLKGLGIKNPLVELKDGLNALEFITANISENQADNPYLILLDLNMPRMDGFDFLKAMKEHDLLRYSTIIVLTTSNDENDRNLALELGAKAIINKKNVSPNMNPVLELLDGFHLMAKQ